MSENDFAGHKKSTPQHKFKMALLNSTDKHVKHKKYLIIFF